MSIESSPKVPVTIQLTLAEYTSISAMALLVRTQDVRGTSHPIYQVEVDETFYGYDPDYAYQGFPDDVAWLDSEGPVEPELAATLEAAHQDGDDVSDEYTRTGFEVRARVVEGFFTMAAAERFIERHKHKRWCIRPRVYVASGYSNEEWQVVRRLLLAFAPAPEGQQVTRRESGGEVKA